MKHHFLAALCAATALSVIPATATLAQSQGRGVATCAPNNISCQNSGGPSAHAGKNSPGKQVVITPQKAPAQSRAPRVGDSGKHGQPFVRAKNSRFGPPPRGQDYRIVNGNLVLLDQRTLRIVSVIGALDALTR